ncbi:hypothetical protein HBH42_010630 [Parastagonospora nodorum]|nr:hypothetical protein HBH42_010630 [Parastagonospora nodorum]
MCNLMPTSLIKELGARHSLLNLSVYDLVEERRNYSLPCKLSNLYKAGTSLVMDTLIVTPIKNNDNLLNTINSHIKLRKLKEKYLKVCEADALKQVGANVREGGNKNYSSLYYSNKLEAQLRKASEEEELAKTKKEKREKEAWERKARLDSLLDSDDYCLDSSSDINSEDDLEDEEERLKALLNAKYSLCKSRDSNRTLHFRRLIGAYILYFKELLSNNGRIFASNEVVAIDSANSILCDLSDLLVIRFCIFSDPALENIGILMNKEVVEMQTDTATALANKLAAVNKLVRLQTFTLKILEHVEIVYWIIAEANMPAVHLKATKHFCGFRKVDRHVFRANNTMSVTAYFIRIFESITKDTNRKHRLCLERGSAVDKVIGKHTYKMCNRVYALVINRQWRDVVANVRCSAD